MNSILNYRFTIWPYTVTNEMKKTAWHQVLSGYNSRSTDFRNLEQLKGKIGNMWRSINLYLTQEKRHKTGGGPPVPDMSAVLNQLMQLRNNSSRLRGLGCHVESGNMDKCNVENEEVSYTRD